MDRKVISFSAAWSKPTTKLLLLTVIVGFVFASTASYHHQVSATNVLSNLTIDSQAAALAAWNIALNYSLDLREFATHRWVHEFPSGFYTDRPPGIVFISVPAYFLLGSEQVSYMPATLTAVLATTLAVVFMYLVFCKLLSPTQAFFAALIFAFGTSTWGFSAKQLWPHGPAQLFLAVALFLASKEQNIRSGLFFGFALLVRPITLLIPAVYGVSQSLMQRNPGPALRIAVFSFLSLLFLLIYTYWLTDEIGLLPKVTGHYIESARTVAPNDYLARIFGVFFSPAHGLFIWTPFLLVLTMGLVPAWRASPFWVRSAFISGIIFILLHVRFNRVSGGVVYGYRYPLEMLVMIAPMYVLCFREWVLQKKLRLIIFAAAVITSLYLHAVLAMSYHCVLTGEGGKICYLF